MLVHEDHLCILFTLSQFQVELRDGGGLVADNRATVNVFVLRNKQPPIFFTDVYNVTIREDVSINTEVVTVSATDADTAVSLFFFLFLSFLSHLFHYFGFLFCFLQHFKHVDT